jgi:hypothetical protein
MILDDGSIVIANATGAYRFASPTASPTKMQNANTFLGRIFGASLDGSEIVGRSGEFAPGVPTRWRSSAFSATTLATPGVVDSVLASYSVGGMIYGAATYDDGTTGIAAWTSSGTYQDLRVLITNPSQWTLTSPVGVTSSGTVVLKGM